MDRNLEIERKRRARLIMVRQRRSLIRRLMGNKDVQEFYRYVYENSLQPAALRLLEEAIAARRNKPATH